LPEDKPMADSSLSGVAPLTVMSLVESYPHHRAGNAN